MWEWNFEVGGKREARESCQGPELEGMDMGRGQEELARAAWAILKVGIP